MAEWGGAYSYSAAEILQILEVVKGFPHHLCANSVGFSTLKINWLLYASRLRFELQLQWIILCVLEMSHALVSYYIQHKKWEHWCMQTSKTSNSYHDGRRKTKLKNDYHGMLSFFSAVVGCGPLRIVNTFQCRRSEEQSARRRGWWENLARTNTVEKMNAIHHVELSESNEGSEQATLESATCHFTERAIGLRRRLRGDWPGTIICNTFTQVRIH